MKTHTHLALICLSLLTPSLFGQTNAPADLANAVATPPPIPEEARKHFVMGTTLFKDAKTADDYAQVVGEFKQATDLAPQWPDARYNLALAKEAAGDYSGAEADLKTYQQFKLSDTEARAAQDKIYVLEAKQEKAVKQQVDARNTDAAEQSDQKIVVLQRKYSELINKLEGTTFTGNYGGDVVTLHFLRRPFDVATTPPTSFKPTPYLCDQPFEQGRYGQPFVVIPTSDNTFCEIMSADMLRLGLNGMPISTFSQDGHTLTVTDSDGKHTYTKDQ